MFDQSEGVEAPLPRPPQHIAALDGVRGLAILLVLAHHLIYVNPQPQSWVYVWARAIKESAWGGVDIFFALSGFLITGILLKQVETEHYFRNFYIRRSLRIFPLYYFVLFVLFACTPWLQIHWGGQQWRLLSYTNHLTLDVHGSGWNFYFGGWRSLVNFWSLHVEEQFYLVWPVLVYFVRDRRWLLALALLLSAASLALRLWAVRHGVAPEIIYSTLLTRADNLLIGAAFAIVLQTGMRRRALRLAKPVFVLAAAALGVIFFVHHGLVWNKGVRSSLQFTLLALAATGLIGMALEPRSWASAVLSTRLPRLAGKYSYGLYVYHSILPMFVLPPLLRVLGPYAAHALLIHLLTSAVELASTVIVTLLSFHSLEAPCLRLKHFFEPRAEQAAASLTAIR